MLLSKTGSETTGVCPSSLGHGKEVTNVKLVRKILETRRGRKEREGREKRRGKVGGNSQ